MAGLKVDYDKEVTPEQVKQIDDLLREEFRTGEWETVESETDKGKMQ